MEVYIELALAENFCLDWTLLYCAAKATKNPCSKRRIALAAAVGACFAVVFSLFTLHAAVSVIIKILSGAALCLIAGRFTRPSGFVKFALAFLAFTFALGGALIALFNLAGWSYSSSGGFFLSSVPIGIPLFGALVFAIFAKKIASRLTAKYSKNRVRLRIFAGQSCAELTAFYDSGNCVTYRGAPVSVIPERVARGLVDVSRIKTFVNVHTVADSKKMAVFKADKIEIDDGEEKKLVNNAIIGVSPRPIRLAILHPDLSEDN